MKPLKLALVHADIRYKKTKTNRMTLLDLIRKSAQQGARIIFVHLQLTREGILDNAWRRKRMSNRLPQYYHDCYLNMQPIRDLTSFLDLPPPGLLNIHGVVPGINEHQMDAILRHLPGNTEDSENLFLLSPFAYSESSLEQISVMAREKNSGIVLCYPNHEEQYIYLFRKKMIGTHPENSYR